MLDKLSKPVAGTRCALDASKEDGHTVSDLALSPGKAGGRRLQSLMSPGSVSGPDRLIGVPDIDRQERVEVCV